MEPIELVNDGRLPIEIVDGVGVRLRQLRDSDVDDLAAACADPLTQRFLPMLPNPYTREDAVWWVTVGAAAARAAGGVAYAVADPVTDRLVGGTGIGRVVAERSQGEVGYWVAPWARRRGVATAATVALSRWAFANGLARLELLTELSNAVSQRVALAAGYRREGVRRAAGEGPEGRRHDLAVWARLADDPPGPTHRPLPDLPGGALSDGMVTLRPLSSEDTDEVYGVRVLPEVVAAGVLPKLPDRAEVAVACARAASRWLAGERVELTIRDAATGTLAGEIGLYYSEPFTGQAMVGCHLLPRWRGRGYATRAVRLLARWAFTHTGIARLVAGAAPDNVASHRVLERAGFTREGLLRGRLPAAGGGRLDDVQYGLLPGDTRG